MAIMMVKYSDKPLLGFFLTNSFFHFFFYICALFFYVQHLFHIKFLYNNNWLKFRGTIHLDIGCSFAAYAVKI